MVGRELRQGLPRLSPGSRGPLAPLLASHFLRQVILSLHLTFFTCKMGFPSLPHRVALELNNSWVLVAHTS
jgi:hypothetical protein